jgi:RpiB/LacA/LacB family sugar-phosphate isomerase
MAVVMATIILASDHAGFDLKESVKAFLKRRKHFVIDSSPVFVDGDDYPDSAVPAAKRVVKEGALGVFFCGSGAGMCICANKVKGVRAALAFDVRSAVDAREEDDCRVICLSGWRTKPRDAARIVEKFLSAKFRKGRFLRRIKKISSFEN